MSEEIKYIEEDVEYVKKEKNLKRKARSSNLVVKNDVFQTSSLKKLKNNFGKDPLNKIVQNALCSNWLYNVSEEREYMQSRDRHFTHTIEPQLMVTNQGLSGRCWMFAVLNVLRYEFVRDLHLPKDFEFSESYLSFYEKIEKCNYFLTQFMDKTSIETIDDDYKTIVTLMSGLSEGGYWISCVNLIKKYGLVPKSCYLESVNSFCTHTVDGMISTKLREFSLKLISEKIENRMALKSKMMEEIYGMLSKMLGTPPSPTEEIEWTYSSDQQLLDLLRIEEDRKESGKYETLKLKELIKITPLNFYKEFVSNDFDDYLSIAHDPRNLYGKYYESSQDDYIVGGKKNGHLNLEINEFVGLCINSILNNTPVQFCCDVSHYFHPDENLFDTKSFNYDLLFGTKMDGLSKKDSLLARESYPNHAMVLVGVDLSKDGTPLKWKVENSWGRTNETHSNNGDYYIMSHDWFERYVYGAVIHKKFAGRQFVVKYNNEKKNKIVLPNEDPMS